VRIAGPMSVYALLLLGTDAAAQSAGTPVVPGRCDFYAWDGSIRRNWYCVEGTVGTGDSSEPPEGTEALLWSDCDFPTYNLHFVTNSGLRLFSLSPFGRVEALAFRRKLQRETVRRWPHEHSVQPCLRPMARGQVDAVRLSRPASADGGSVAGYGRHGDPRSLSSRRQPTLTHVQWFREAIGFSRWSVHSRARLTSKDPTTASSGT